MDRLKKVTLRNDKKASYHQSVFRVILARVLWRISQAASHSVRTYCRA